MRRGGAGGYRRARQRRWCLGTVRCAWTGRRRQFELRIACSPPPLPLPQGSDVHQGLSHHQCPGSSLFARPSPGTATGPNFGSRVPASPAAWLPTGVLRGGGLRGGYLVWPNLQGPWPVPLALPVRQCGYQQARRPGRAHLDIPYSLLGARPQHRITSRNRRNNTQRHIAIISMPGYQRHGLQVCK